MTITHAALTEHRVTARAEEPLPEEAFASGDRADSSLIHLTAREGDTGETPDITLFQAYATLVREGHEEFRSQMNDVLESLSRTSPNDPIVLSALARRAAGKGTPAASGIAINYFTRAIKAGSTEHDIFLLLAGLYSRSHRAAEAIGVLRDGMKRYPYSPEFPESLAAEYIEIGDYRSALEVIRSGLQLFPDDGVLRRFSKKVQSAGPVE